MKVGFIVFLWILFISVATLGGSPFQQTYSFKQIDIEQGLPGSNIRNLFQDSRGIMWLSVEGMGLCRYDGYKFTLFGNNVDDENSLSNNFVNRITEDKDGYLWIATDKGLNRYDYRTNKIDRYFYNPNDSLSIPDDVVHSMDKDVFGNIWISTGNGFAYVDILKQQFRRFLHTPREDYDSVEIYKVKRIKSDKHSNLWVMGGFGIKKYRFSGNFKIIEDVSETTTLRYFKSEALDMVEDSYNYLWFGLANNILKYSILQDSYEYYIKPNDTTFGFQNIKIPEMAIDNKEMIWVGTMTNGILIIDPSTNKYVKITKQKDMKNCLQSDHIRGIYVDNEKNVWIGTKFSGFYRNISKDYAFFLWPEKYSTFQEINNKYIFCIEKDKQNKDIIWVGTKFSGFYKVNIVEKTVVNYNWGKKKNEISNKIHIILKDSDNNLWIGTNKGLYQFYENQDKYQKISTDIVNTLFEDNLNNIWVGTTLGLRLLDKTNKKLIKHNFSDTLGLFDNDNYDFLYISQDKQENLWFSTRYHGVFVYNQLNRVLYNISKDKLPESKINTNLVRMTFEDSKNNMWLCTKESGLVLFNRDTKICTLYTAREGLPSNFVMNILEDFDGNLWIGNFNGISKFDPETKLFTNFNQEYGLKSNIIELGCHFAFDDGALMLGGNDGFNIFYPNSVMQTENTSPLVITSIKIFENEIYRDVTEPLKLDLKYSENNISFEFIVSSYNFTSRHQFKCYMRGLDRDSIFLGTRNYVSYTNLKPGNYNFMVKGANEMGLWNKGLIVEITIGTPWWQTWIFRIIALLFILGMLFLVYYLRLFQIKKQKKELEKMVLMRTEELNETNTLLEERQQYIEEQTEELMAKKEDLETINDHLNETNSLLEERQHYILEQAEILKAQTDVLEKKNDELNKLNATKDKLFSIIAHDLKTPFTTVMGFLELVIFRYNSMDDEKRINMISIAYESSKNIFKLLENLLQWSRSQTDAIKFIPQNVDFSEIVNTNFELISQLATKKGIKLIKNIEEGMEIYSDKNMINTIIRNLLTNAIKFTNKGSITIKAENFDNKSIIKISDTGIGINQEKIDTLFSIEKNKSTKGTNGESGTGLGLIICKDFIDKHHGNIEVDSEIGKGTTFIIEIPLHR